jgi:hypothetical protein
MDKDVKDEAAFWKPRGGRVTRLVAIRSVVGTGIHFRKSTVA